MMKQKRIAFFSLFFAIALSACCAEEEAAMRITTDRAVYRPGSRVLCAVDDLSSGTAEIRLRLMHPDATVLEVTVAPGAEEISFVLPDRDFTGYLLVAEGLDARGLILETAMTGIDCSSSWTRFPRYGYLWDYRENTDARKKIGELSRYHLNGLQFYDWQYRHHIPVSPDPEQWQDWSGRTVRGDVLREYLDAAHSRGMVCLAYNMIYAANGSYLTDGSGVDPAWRLLKGNGSDFTVDMDAGLGPVGILQYFNPLNPGWQQYIFSREAEVFSAFDFDGWHGDTIGEMGFMKAADGGPLGTDESGKPIRYVKDTYTRFLNAAKEAIGDRYLVFNPVGAQGFENVNISRVDVLYTEFWPWDKDDRGLPYADYYSIHRAIRRANEQSGGKSLVVAGYINYRNPASTFNAPAVQLMDSVVFASGGARIELGNGDCMLSDEYFPGDGRKRMDDGLRKAMQRMYDFIVAYENLLRDGQKPVEGRVSIEDTAVSDNGWPDTVWCFARADVRHEIYHFINLTGTDCDWRDTAQSKKAPEPRRGLKTRIHTDFPVKEVCIASPDTEDLAVHTLPFERGEDAEGAYILFTQPDLAYWNMVFLR